MRISFPLPSASTSNPTPTTNPTVLSSFDATATTQNDDASIQYITEFTQSSPPTRRLIPPIPNQWDPSNSSTITAAVDSLTIDAEEAAIRKLKEDLKGLPEMEEFGCGEEPVEGFGAAVLAGYGWEEGRGIGRNAGEDVGVKEFRSNVGRRGLGFRSE